MPQSGTCQAPDEGRNVAPDLFGCSFIQAVWLYSSTIAASGGVKVTSALATVTAMAWASASGSPAGLRNTV